MPAAFINDVLEINSWQYNHYCISAVGEMTPPEFRLSQFTFHFLNLLSAEKYAESNYSKNASTRRFI
jgi:hypothetical protein